MEHGLKDDPGPLPDIATARWHTSVRDVYPDRRSLGLDLSGIIDNIPQFVYQRGGQILSDLMWEVANKRPKIRQFVLTSSDYCKLYVSVVSFHVRRQGSVVTRDDLGEDFVHVPMSYGLISRTPYLSFPKVFLSNLYYLTCTNPEDPEVVRASIVRAIALMMHGVPVPIGQAAMTCWNWPALPGFQNESQMVMGDCGLEGMEESRPIQNSFSRGASEVDLVALFDMLSVEVIMASLGALLLEQKVLLVSSKWSSCFVAHLCEALRVLLYPFDWQHVYIPLIPPVSMGDLTGGPQVPFWIEAATTTDHIHPLRFLEVPAPLLGGLRIKTQMPMVTVLRHLYSDINIVDVDANIFLPAAVRVDRVSSALPQIPRKLVQQVSARLAAASLDIGESKLLRMPKYAAWDQLVPVEFFRGVSSPPQPPPAVRRRSSLWRNEAAKGEPPEMHARMSWFGGSQKSSSVSWGADCSNALIIQSAVLESLVKIFFAYPKFLQTASSPKALFTGDDRSFQARQFLKALDRCAPSDSPFVKALLTTQCWDLFVRTTAQHPICATFDSACELYGQVFGGEFSKFTAHGGPPGTTITPAGRKAKEFFFEELLSLVAKQRRIECVFNAAPIDLACTNACSADVDICAIVSRVLTEDLPFLFPDPNLEAAKLGWIANQRSGDVAISTLLEAWKILDDEKKSAHILHAVLAHLRISHPCILNQPSPPDLIPDDCSSHTRLDDSVSLWSHSKRRAVEEGKLLGGIPKILLAVRVPPIPSFLIRRWEELLEEAHRSLRVVFRLRCQAEYGCGGCGGSVGFLEALRRGGFASTLSSSAGPSMSSSVQFSCPICQSLITPVITPSSSARVPILRLDSLFREMAQSPTSPLVVHNLDLLAGVFVEVYSRHQLRGVVSLSDLLADLVQAVKEESAEAASAEGSPVALAGSPIESDDGGGQTSEDDDPMPPSPRSRAKWRVRQYRRSKQLKKMHAPEITMRIHVDERVSLSGPHFSPLPNPVQIEPVAPPSERRPESAAPRRVRRSSEKRFSEN